MHERRRHKIEGEVARETPRWNHEHLQMLNVERGDVIKLDDSTVSMADLGDVRMKDKLCRQMKFGNLTRVIEIKPLTEEEIKEMGDSSCVHEPSGNEDEVDRPQRGPRQGCKII